MRTQNSRLREYFKRFLETQGYCTPPGRAACALQSARTLLDWQVAEAAGLVRLKAEPEEESYFDVFGKPDTDQERKQIEATLERDGCWCVVSEVNTGSEASGDHWQHVDSVGMCVYANPLDPFENDYVVGLMAAALKAVPQPGNVDELCTDLHE